MATLKCGECGKDNYFNIKTEMPEDQTLSIRIDYEGDFLKAKTVWSVIENFEKLMIYAGKDSGQKVSVSIREITQKNKKLQIDFFIESEPLKSKK